MTQPVNPADCGATFMLCRECVKCLTFRLEQAEAEVKKNSDEWHELWESRDKVIQEREQALQARNQYWFDLSRIAGICDAADNESTIKAVERTVKERNQLRPEAVRLALVTVDKSYQSQRDALAELIAAVESLLSERKDLRDKLITVCSEVDKMRADRRQLLRRLVECRPWVGVCPFPNQPGFDEMLAIRDLADDTLAEVKE